MATEKQIEANRRNSKASTGPRTTEGKERSRMNASTHGMSSPNGIVELPTESPEEFKAFKDRQFAALKPANAVQEEYATQYAEDSWRLRRAPKIERGVLAHGVADADARDLTAFKRRFEVTNGDIMKAQLKAGGIPDPDEVVKITNLELHEEAELSIYETLDQKREDECRLASGFMEDAAGANALGKLSRYETMLSRRRDNALKMLLALQAEQDGDES